MKYRNLKMICVTSLLCIPVLGFATDSFCIKAFFLKKFNTLATRAPAIPMLNKFHWIAEVDAQTIRKYESEKIKSPSDKLPESPIDLNKLFTHLNYLAGVALWHPTTIKKYSTERGLFLYAKVYTKGDIQKAKNGLRLVASSQHYEQMEWWKYTGSLWDLNQHYQWKTFTKLEHLFKGMEGYALASNIFFDGDMAKAFKATLALSDLPEKLFIAKTEWKYFDGKTHHFYPTRRQVTNYKGHLLEEYKQVKGLRKLADNIYTGNDIKAFMDIQAVLNDSELKQIAWPIDILQKQSFKILSQINGYRLK